MREHPHVIESMFTKLGDSVPENLRIEGRTASAQRDKMFGQPSNRKSLGLAELVGENSQPAYQQVPHIDMKDEQGSIVNPLQD